MAALVTVTIIVAAWGLWVRRSTWCSRWDAAVSAAIPLGGVGLILSAPAAHHVVHPLQVSFTSSVIEAFVGNVCYVLASALLVVHVLGRLQPPEQLRVSLRRRVAPPVVVILVLLPVVGVAGIDGVPSRWLTAYWVLLCAVIVYLLVYAVCGLIDLREYEHHRRRMNLPLVACGLGIIAKIIDAAAHLYYGLMHPGGAIIVAITALWVAGLAVAAAYAWREQLRTFKQHAPV